MDPTTEIQNPIRENETPNIRKHGLGRTAGGTKFRYSKGVNYKTITLAWEEMREVEKLALDAFFDSMNGPTTSFTYIDHKGTSHTVFFLVDELPWIEKDDSTDSTSTFTIDLCDFPTSTRKDTIYGLEIELEIVSTP